MKTLQLGRYLVPIKLHEKRAKTKARIASTVVREGPTLRRRPQPDALMYLIEATTLEAAYRELCRQVEPQDRVDEHREPADRRDGDRLGRRLERREGEKPDHVLG